MTSSSTSILIRETLSFIKVIISGLDSVLDAVTCHDDADEAHEAIHVSVAPNDKCNRQRNYLVNQVVANPYDDGDDIDLPKAPLNCHNNK